jgi:hypothetical protein
MNIISEHEDVGGISHGILEANKMNMNKKTQLKNC